jgi:hypothetical protein
MATRVSGLGRQQSYVPSGSTGSRAAAVVINCLQDVQTRLQRVKSKQSQLQGALEELEDILKSNPISK